MRVYVGKVVHNKSNTTKEAFMCTAITYRTKDLYFGRNLDLEYHYREAVTVTPRNYPFCFRNGTTLSRHYAMIGMATVSGGYPLYYEATNEKGVSLAGLSFPKSATYYGYDESKQNVAPFELIPWLLGRCASVQDALDKLSQLNLWNTPFSEEFPLSPLHFLLADKDRAVAIEPLETGLKIQEDPVGVLTNEPPLDFHLFNLANYMGLTSEPAENRFSAALDLEPYSLGMGAMGLPGDPSSASRFVRAAFTKLHSITGESEAESVSQFFHILSSVEQVRGVTAVREGEYEYTLYSSCCNTNTGVYYYTTYDDRTVTAVDMHGTDLEGNAPVSFPVTWQGGIYSQNQ